jgi:hypothetical protein
MPRLDPLREHSGIGLDFAELLKFNRTEGAGPEVLFGGKPVFRGEVSLEIFL